MAKTVRVKAAAVGLLPMSHRPFALDSSKLNGLSNHHVHVKYITILFVNYTSTKWKRREKKKNPMTAIHMYLLLFRH